MKIKPKQYALALYEALYEAKNKNEQRRIIRNFVKLLAARNNLEMGEAVTSEFVSICDDRDGLVRVEADTARPLDQTSKKEVEAFVQALSGAKRAVVTERVEDGIIGGIILRFKDKVVDASLKTGLEDLRAKMKK